jgi:hypothetical protein
MRAEGLILWEGVGSELFWNFGSEEREPTGSISGLERNTWAHLFLF